MKPITVLVKPSTRPSTTAKLPEKKELGYTSNSKKYRGSE